MIISDFYLDQCQHSFNKVRRNKYFPGGSDSKESACNVGDLCSIPGLARSPGGGHDNPLQYSCLENPMDRRAWRATILRIAKLDTIEAT